MESVPIHHKRSITPQKSHIIFQGKPSENSITFYIDDVSEGLSDIIVEDFTYNTTKTNTYHSLLYETHPRTRVFWSSIDSFTVYNQGFVFRYPIIQYSTYANDLGEGKQMIYIDNTMIGKALTVTGCVSNDVCMNETFIVRK